MQDTPCYVRWETSALFHMFWTSSSLCSVKWPSSPAFMSQLQAWLPYQNSRVLQIPSIQIFTRTPCMISFSYWSHNLPLRSHCRYNSSPWVQVPTTLPATISGALWITPNKILHKHRMWSCRVISTTIYSLGSNPGLYLYTTSGRFKPYHLRANFMTTYIFYHGIAKASSWVILATSEF